MSTYDETKYRAHVIAEERAAQGAPIVIVQPGCVYGPGDHALVGQMIDQASTGKMPAKAFPELGLNMVHVDDVADGIMLAYDKGKPGESYVLGGEITTQGDLIDRAAAIGGKKPPRMTVPPIVLKALIPVGRWVGPMMGLPPNFREMISAAHNVTYWAKDDKARQELGYSRATSTRACARRSAQAEPLDRRQHAAGRELLRQARARAGPTPSIQNAWPTAKRCAQSAQASASISSIRRCQRSPPSSTMRSLLELVDPQLHPVRVTLRGQPAALERPEDAVRVGRGTPACRCTRPRAPRSPSSASEHAERRSRSASCVEPRTRRPPPRHRASAARRPPAPACPARRRAR